MKKIILGVLVLSIVIAGQAFAGNFSQSCKDIKLDGTHLQAKCLKAAKAVYGDTTEIKLNDHIGNNSGTLVWGSKNFKDHCNNLVLELPNYSQALLKASCKNNVGNYGTTQINLNERISNIDGKLKYE